MSDEPPKTRTPEDERLRRWRLALGTTEKGGLDALLGGDDRRIDDALSALYGSVVLDAPPDDDDGALRDRKNVGRGPSRPVAARWLGEVRELFPSSVVKVIQREAFERLNMKSLLGDPEFLESVEPNVHLLATLASLRGAIPDSAKDAARRVVARVVEQLMARIEHRVQAAVRGAKNRGTRSRRPRFSDIDWARTIEANLRHYLPERGALIPERLVGFGRKKRASELDDIILCVDQSGSMLRSVIYASVFAAVLASIPTVSTKLVCYDTEVVDLSDQLSDPVEVLFGVQLGGGNDTPKALAYCEQLIRRPEQTHLILISDLFEGSLSQDMIERLGRFVAAGVRLVVLLSLDDEGRSSYDTENAKAIAAMGVAVFACTPERFPELMGAALRGEDLFSWAASIDLNLVRG